MTQGWADFFGILEDERELLEQIIVLLDKERSLITILDAEGLVQNAKAKENLALKIRMVEQGRLTLLHRLAPELGLAPETVCLSTLAQAAPPDLASRLESYRDSFTELIDRLHRHMEANGMLLQSSVSLINGLQDELARLLGCRVTYSKAGGFNNEPEACRLNGSI